MVAAGKTRKEEGGQWSRRTLGTRKEHPVVVTATSVPGQQGFLTLMQAFFFISHTLYLGYSQLLDARSLLGGGLHAGETNLPPTTTNNTRTPPPKKYSFFVKKK